MQYYRRIEKCSEEEILNAISAFYILYFWQWNGRLRGWDSKHKGKDAFEVKSTFPALKKATEVIAKNVETLLACQSLLPRSDMLSIKLIEKIKICTKSLEANFLFQFEEANRFKEVKFSIASFLAKKISYDDQKKIVRLINSRMNKEIGVHLEDRIILGNIKRWAKMNSSENFFLIYLKKIQIGKELLNLEN